MKIRLFAFGLVALLLAGLCPTRLHAQAGSLNTGFNVTGVNDFVNAVAVQPDGKVIVVGDFTSVDGVAYNRVARLNADGSLDTSFNPGTGANSSVVALALQADGSVIIGGGFGAVNGTGRSYLARLKGDGSLDGSFAPINLSDYGVVRSVAVQANGKVIIGGDFTSIGGVTRNHIARLNADSTLDTSFDPGAGADDIIYTVASQNSDEKVIIGGKFASVNGVAHAAIARLNADGSLDTSFDPIVTPDSYYGYNYAETLLVQADGKIVFGGEFSSVNGVARAGLARLNVDGSVDPSFNSGTGTNHGGIGNVTLQPDGKIVVGGTFNTFNFVPRNYVARLNTDGSVDATFDPGTGPNGSVYGIAVQPNGKVVIGGIFTAVDGVARPYVARLNSYPPVIVSSTTASVQVGMPFNYQIAATFSPTSYGASPLPAGLSVDPVGSLISGTPTVVGTSQVTMSAGNASGVGTATLALTVSAPPVNIQSVDILSPPVGISIVQNEPTTLEVSVTALPGTLANVNYDVYDSTNTTLVEPLGSTTAAGHSEPWYPQNTGTFTLRVSATDTANHIVTSQFPIDVITSPVQPPISVLLSGLDGKSFALDTSVPLVALATDASGNALTDVKFYLDGALQSGASASTVSAVGSGAHRQDAAGSPFARASAKIDKLVRDALLTVASKDSHGVTSVSNPATIHIIAAAAVPSCGITSPSGIGTYAPGASVTATASALETGGSVAQVEYFLDDRSVGKATGAAFTLAFALPAAAGQHALTAIATDAQGVSAASAPVILSAVGTLTPPVVTIADAGNTSVTEGANAKLVVQRNATSTAITVHYKVAGTAKTGIDYKPLTGSVTLPIGVASAKIKLKTTDNHAVDGTRVAKVKLLPATDGSYTLGTAFTAKLKITDND